MTFLTHCKQSLLAAILTIGLGSCAFGSGVAVFVLSQNKMAHPAPVAVFPAPITLADSALTAQSAIVYDPHTGRILFAKNAEAPRPLASLTKLMTAQVVLAHSASSTAVRITSDDLQPSGDWGLRPGDTLTLHDLLKLGLVASSNDAMAAAAASLGSSYLTDMNDTAVQLGLTQTRFLNPTGLDENADTAGAYGSAYDVARLTAVFYAEHPDYFSLTQQSSVRVPDGDRTLAAAATALPLLNEPGFLGAKTGYTDLAGGNLVAVFDIEIGHPLVAVVLGSTETGRFDDIRTLITAVRTETTL